MASSFKNTTICSKYNDFKPPYTPENTLFDF